MNQQKRPQPQEQKPPEVSKGPTGMSLFFKINFLIFMLVFLSVGTSTLFSITRQTQNLENALLQRDQLIVDQAALAVQGAFFTLNWSFVEEMLHKTVKNPDIRWICVFRPDGDMYLCGGPPKEYQGKIRSVIEKKGVMADKDTVSFQLATNDFELIKKIPIGKESWFVSLGGTMEGISRQNRQLINTNLIWALATVLVGIFIGSLFLRKITRPLSEISDAARDIAQGNFGRQIHLETGDEIEMLADQFNLMSAALEKSYNALTSYNDDLAREVKKRTEAQQVVNRRLRSILQTTDQGFWLVDNTLITREINPRMAEILGRPSEEIVGRSILEFFSGKDRKFFELSLRGEIDGKTRRRQVILKRSGRSSLACLVGVTPLMLGEFGARSGAFAMFTDVSVLKTVMRKLRIAKENAEKANRAKSYFLANMSHEIRTPLNGIIGMLHLLSGTQLEEEQQKMLRSAQHSSDFLLNLLNDLLDLSKIEAGQLELEKRPFSISGLLDQLESMFSVQAAERGLKFTTSLSSDVPAVLIGDHLRLRQILANLLSNSFKFTRQGFIGVHIGLADRTEKRVVLHCRVEDTGIGVATEKQDEIFQSFIQADSSTTRNFGGTGLGLAICRELCALMNGSIRLESEEGQGSIFHCIVELAIGDADQLLDCEQSDTTEATDSGPLSILVVEDNETNREVARMTLEQEGHRIILARDGVEALEKMVSEKFDLVLMDMQMPKMDGITACRVIRACERGEVAEVDDGLQSLLEQLVKKIQGSYTPIIALTANVMRTDRERCAEAGMDDYLSKPIQPQEITRVLFRFSPGEKQKSPPVDTPSVVPSGEESAPLARARNHLRSMYNFTDEQFEKLLQTALATLRADLRDLETAFAGGDMELVGAKAHKLKGSLVMLGLQDAADNTVIIETHAREKKMESIGELIDQLQQQLTEILVQP